MSGVNEGLVAMCKGVITAVCVSIGVRFTGGDGKQWPVIVCRWVSSPCTGEGGRSGVKVVAIQVCLAPCTRPAAGVYLLGRFRSVVAPAYPGMAG